jgi:nucleotide-binding universal stress UspA family protein
MATPQHREPGASVVLVGVDFSEPSLEALRIAENIARASPRSELHLVYAMSLPAGPLDAPDLSAYREKLFGGQVSRGRERLDRLAAGATVGIDRVMGHVRVGTPAAAILELAADVGAGLIVLGAPSHTGVARWVFGSTAEKVGRRAPCAVLIARPKTVPAWEQIEPVCPDCAHVQRTTEGQRLWCDRHSQHRPRPHTYHESSGTFGMGSMTFRA